MIEEFMESAFRAATYGLRKRMRRALDSPVGCVMMGLKSGLRKTQSLVGASLALMLQ